MSLYTTPFVVLNIGSEMIFVLAQRLEAQNIPPDKTALVLDDIIAVLISKHLIGEIMKPQKAYAHDSVRDIMQNVAQSSVMRLDPVSMGKLWDLITMVVKWQVTMTRDVIQYTLRHLYEIETYVTKPETHIQLQKVQNLVENFNKLLTPYEKHRLYEDITQWLKNFYVRVSLLLRMGLQDPDGSFVHANLSPIAKELIRNVGENLYAVTQNGKIVGSRRNSSKTPEINEMQLFVEQISASRKLSSSSTDGTTLRLNISDPNADGVEACPEMGKDIKISRFDSIDVQVEDNLMDLVRELSLEDKEKENSVQDELLEMIGGGE